MSGDARASKLRITFVALLASSVLAGCSVREIAVDFMADALAESGNVYAEDDDPDLVREALPFGLKTFEGLAVASPENAALRAELAKGFAVYAFLLHDEADRLDAANRARANQLRKRASKLYLRARDYALDALDISQPDFLTRLKADSLSALAKTTIADIDALYWAGVSWAASASLDKDNLDLIGDLPTAAGLVTRVLVLDETFDRGAAHEFFIAYEGGRPGGSADAARQHYRRALELSQGQRASVHVTLAETVVVSSQDRAEFEQLLELAMAVEPDAIPEMRLANTLAHRRARWLLSRATDLFVLDERMPAS
ncbi:MAG: TRAP transporter TatT component family protein [Proteobacteria bacterium]|nr:TRAP transporter TatT component family protein [Pseudomonadota bacterium]